MIEKIVMTMMIRKRRSCKRKKMMMLPLLIGFAEGTVGSGCIGSYWGR